MEINERNLKMLETVISSKSITQASKALYISQPALTKALNSLEDDIGVKLLNRSSSPIRPTKAGTLYLKKGNEILQLIRMLQYELEELSQKDTCKLNLGISNSRATAWLPYIIPQFNALYPKIDVAINGESSVNLEKMLRNRAINLAAGPLSAAFTDLEYTFIRNEGIVLAANSQHPLFKNYDMEENSISNPVTIDPILLSEEVFILPPQNSRLYFRNLELFKKYNIVPKQIIYTNSETSAYLMAATGMGITFTGIKVPNRLTYSASSIPVFGTLDAQDNNAIYFAHRKEDIQNPAIQSFISIARCVLDSHPEL